MRLFTPACLATVVLAVAPQFTAAADPVKLDSVLLTLIEQVDVPAREAGELSALHVREGQLVKEGTLVDQVDDRDAQLVTRKAHLERDTAAKEPGNDVRVGFQTE